jgi:hypothetical protein
MTGLIFGCDPTETQRKPARRSKEALRAGGIRIGTPSGHREPIEGPGEARIQRVALQWLELDDLEGPERLARALPEG